MLFARVGSDFEAPRGAGVGPYRGVEVFDWGLSGIAGETPVGEPCTIGGVAAWHRKTDDAHAGQAVHTWVAHVDGRFVVISHYRELIEQALLRSGRLDRLLMPFASLPALPSESECVVYLLPRPKDRTYWGRPVPIEMTRASLSPDGCLRLWHRQPLPEQFTSLAGDAHAPTVTTSEDGWQVTEIELPVDAATRWLVFEMLSGMAIFI